MENYDQKRVKGTGLRLALISMVLGYAGLISFFAAGLFAFTVEAIGLVDLLRGLVIPLAAFAVITGLIAGSRLQPEDSREKKQARLGIRLGAFIFILALLFMVGTFLFFLPFLWA